MATSHFQQFCHDAASPAQDTEAPRGPGWIDGLYTRRLTPSAGTDARRLLPAGIGCCQVNVRGSRRRMKGRSATACVLSSYPYAG